MLQSIVENKRKRNSMSVFTKPIKDLEQLKKFNYVDIKIGSRDASFVNPGLRESKYGLIRYDGPPMMDASAFK